MQKGVGSGRRSAGSTANIRVAIADPRPLIAEALAALIAGGRHFEVAGIESEPMRAVDAIASAPTDLVLVGVGADADEALRLIDALRLRAPRTQIVIVADAPTRELVGAVVERSLGGLLLTDHPGEDLLASLRHIAHGRSVLPTGWQRALAGGGGGPIDTLSDRQLEVLQLLADGCSYEEIARRLFISVNTVKFHTRSIFERLGVRNRMAAARVLAAARANPPG